MKRAQWSSNFSFIMATIGSAVGLGNIWRFPYIMGKNGGAVFLIVYLALIFTICIIPLMCELFLGKNLKKGVIQTFEKINKKFKAFGWICIITVILTSAFYFVVGGWILKYIGAYFINANPTSYSEYFQNFTAEPIAPVILGLLFLLFSTLFPFLGVNKGIERANNIMIPLFFLMLIFLAGFSLSLPNAKEGLDFMFNPDFSKLNLKMILTALGQALFTLSIGFGAIITYGSYLKKSTNIVKSSYILITCDTLIAIIAGMMIFPAVFSSNLTPSAGANLVFITLPEVFSHLPYENFFAIVFFSLLFFAAVTSGMSLMEIPLLAISEKFKISRQKAAGISFTAIALLLIPCAMSFGLLKDFTIFGKTCFDLLDFTTANILLPFNTLIITLMVGWFYLPNRGDIFENEKLHKVFLFATKYLIPLLLILLIAFGLIE